jgi:diguanylate cyclase
MLNKELPNTAIKKAFNNPNQLPSRIYRLRVLGLALGGIVIAAVLIENQVGLPYWLWWLFSCFIWPHLAFIVAKNNQHPFVAERRNLLFDSFIAGSWAALMWFNLLPAVLLLVITTADKVNSGIRNLWLFSQPFMFLGLIIGMISTGLAFKPETSMAVILACIPIMTVHIFFVSMSSYKLIRKVQIQNTQFRELSEKDTLTHLFNRRYWQAQVEALLKTTDKHSNLSMILIDIDNFKQINDRHGHLAGDDVLLGIANLITSELPENAIAGRLGGDELAIVLQEDIEFANNFANKLCQQVTQLEINSIPDLKCTVSIGLAENNPQQNNFRSWFDQADKNLYHAKNSGRNQVC